jgi:fatty-acyl-CoA synthase
LVVEFYAATEANSMLVNPCRTPSRYGFCGVLGPLVWRVTGAKIVSFDVVTEAPVRGPDGFLIEVGPNQTGELLFPAHQSFVILPFEGYTDRDSTQKKILANCFRAGDQYFRTGDLVRRDKRGRVSFEDRIGDTFRWKGENVSTTEVSQVVAGFPGVREANAYGVRVPGHNDRACMVAIYGNPDLPQQLAALRSHCAVLPPYARPLFLRILHEPLQSTSTFKQIKVQLKEEGCDPRRVKDALYWNSPLNRMTYSPLTLENYLALAKSKL